MAEKIGAQRLTRQQLGQWESLSYGMFIHFGMSTFDGNELSLGDRPSSWYAPDRLDVDQWVQVAVEAGMRYAILTAKHVSGHCLWPSRHTDYHVGTSSTPIDVVEKFVSSCRQHGVMPGLYYCSWDNHHLLGSNTPTFTTTPDTSPAYRAFQMAQVEELLTRYGPIGEFWIDIPGVLGDEGLRTQYERVAELQPETVIVANTGLGQGTLKAGLAWPTDVMTIERDLPSSARAFDPWITREVDSRVDDYYVAGEVCDTIGYEWFHVEGDAPRSRMELLGMRLIASERRVNLLLDVPPDRHGLISSEQVEALGRLREDFEATVRAVPSYGRRTAL
jgi:alpha-L-fucosidase